MDIKNLWANLVPKLETKANLKLDLSEGKVPELPYFVVGIDEIKGNISEKLMSIDGNRMVTNFIIGRYGNGKTNLLKYLELFFENHPEVDVIYTRANVDQPDIVLFILKQISDHYTEYLIEKINQCRNKINVADLANNFQHGFKAIEEFTTKLFSKDLDNDDLQRLIYLGTGKLYTKGEFAKSKISYLSNFERREILVMLLNFLASQRKFIIFQIDEIEKIPEKSKLRLIQFFTSYREFIDLYSFINGHYLICSMTEANADDDYIRSLNPPFHRRIDAHILSLPNITEKADIRILVENLNVLFEINNNEEEIEKITKLLNKEKHIQNSYLVRHAVQLLRSDKIKLSLEKLLQNYGLSQIYNTTSRELHLEGLFKSINQKFFDPLETYLIGTYLLNNNDDNEIKSRDYQSFVDKTNERVHYFIISGNIDIDTIQGKIIEMENKYDLDFVIYSPVVLELKNGTILTEKMIEIVDYNPEELFILLNMYRDNFQIQPDIAKVISEYTNGNL